MRQVTTICQVQQEPTRALEWFLHSFATWNYEKKIEEIKWQRVKCAKSQISKSSTMFHYSRLPLFVWELGTCEPICNSTCSCVRADNDVDGKRTLCRRNDLDWDHVQIFEEYLCLCLIIARITHMTRMLHMIDIMIWHDSLFMFIYFLYFCARIRSCGQAQVRNILFGLRIHGICPEAMRSRAAVVQSFLRQRH